MWPEGPMVIYKDLTKYILLEGLGRVQRSAVRGELELVVVFR